MKQLFAVFPSLNQAALVRRHLLAREIYLDLCRTPECLRYTGCSFALKGDSNDMDQLQTVCKEISISLRGVFEADTEQERKPFLELSEEEQ